MLAALAGTATAAEEADIVGLFELVNYYEYSPALMSSGQPGAAQFESIATAGVQAVINLAPASAPDAISNEAELVTQRGMAYTHIPVDWEQPQLEDVRQFLAAMKQYSGRRILVHCYANARASAFVYLYRVLIAGDNAEQAYQTLVDIWDLNPGYEYHNVPHWQALVAEAQAGLH